MATARTANPVPMIGLNNSANGQFKGQMKPAGQESGILANLQQPSAPKKMTCIPQTSGSIK